MACSKPYMEMVKTASGFTPDRPWEPMLGVDFASSWDVKEWIDVAVRIRDEAYRRLYELGDIETALAGTRRAGDAIYPRYSALREIYEPLNEKVTELRRVFDPTELSSVFDTDWLKGSKAFVGDAATVSIDLACLIEQIDGEIKLYGVTPRSLPTTVTGGPGKTDTGSGMGILGTAAVLAAGLGAVYLAIVLSRRNEAQKAVA